MPNYFTEFKNGPSGPSYKVKDEDARSSIETLTDEVSNKVDKVAGKGLSTNDYSDTEKSKVADNASAILAIVNRYGGKNLAPNEATSQTIHNADYTINSDKSVTIIRTSSDGSDANLMMKIKLKLYPGTYIMSCGYSGELLSGVYVALTNLMGITQYSTQDGDNLEFTINQETEFNWYIILKSATVISTPITFYPMIRDVRIKDSTYVPYSMTNKELTEKRARSYGLGDSITTDNTSDIMYGYFVNTSVAIIHFPFNFEKNVSKSNLHVSFTTQIFAFATVGGVKWLNNISINDYYISQSGGLTIEFSFDNDTSLTALTPFVGFAPGIQILIY